MSITDSTLCPDRDLSYLYVFLISICTDMVMSMGTVRFMEHLVPTEDLDRGVENMRVMLGMEENMMSQVCCLR